MRSVGRFLFRAVLISPANTSRHGTGHSVVRLGSTVCRWFRARPSRRRVIAVRCRAEVARYCGDHRAGVVAPVALEAVVPARLRRTRMGRAALRTGCSASPPTARRTRSGARAVGLWTRAKGEVDHGARKMPQVRLCIVYGCLFRSAHAHHTAAVKGATWEPCRVFFFFFFFFRL